MQISEQFIVTVIDKFIAGEIGELEISDGSAKLSLRKNVCHPSAVHAPPPAAPLPAPRAGLPEETITSPIVGTFYAAPGPDSPPFVRPGSMVKKGDTLCILEAMKMMNHLEAEFDCEILSVRAAAGDLVEFGQVLFEVKHLEVPAARREVSSR